MLIVPVSGDRLTLMSARGIVSVSSYTALKSEPAVYLTEPLESGERFAFFSDITTLNGVEVGQKGNLLEASSLVKRKFNLPQPGDTLTTGLIETAFKQEDVDIDVSDVTISGKEPRIVIVKCGTTKLTLDAIQNIERKRGFEKFDRKSFLRYYLDYLPMGVKI